ncbi:MAG: hypothetical protein M3Y59_22590 [Myxococcota bacterium]|nr:hypothetical protein [Myxococcota bacterium]
MKSGWLVLGAAMLVGCGAPIPPDDDDDNGPGCPPGECAPPPAHESLWPMTVGSSWTYKITDPIRGISEKRVRVEKRGTIPGTDREGTLFISEQDHLFEHSWQVEEDGLAKRVREEDLSPDGTPKRSTTWSPLTIKALTLPQSAGWESRVTVVETIVEGGITDDKNKEFIWRVVAVDVDVTVAGVQMKAIQVLRDRQDKEGKARTYWFVPGVGKVREEGERTEELTSFDVKE